MVFDVIGDRFRARHTVIRLEKVPWPETEEIKPTAWAERRMRYALLGAAAIGLSVKIVCSLSGEGTGLLRSARTDETSQSAFAYAGATVR
jgi:hypothetical protein